MLNSSKYRLIQILRVTVKLDNKVLFVCNGVILQTPKSELSEKFGLVFDEIGVYQNQIELKLFYTYMDGELVIGEQLKDLIEVESAAISIDAIDFYNRFGFI